MTVDCRVCGGEGWLPSLPEGRSDCPACGGSGKEPASSRSTEVVEQETADAIESTQFMADDVLPEPFDGYDANVAAGLPPDGDVIAPCRGCGRTFTTTEDADYCPKCADENVGIVDSPKREFSADEVCTCQRISRRVEDCPLHGAQIVAARAARETTATGLALCQQIADGVFTTIRDAVNANAFDIQLDDVTLTADGAGYVIEVKHGTTTVVRASIAVPA